MKSGLINKRNIFDLHIQLHSLLANHVTTFWKKIGTMAPRLRLIMLSLFLWCWMILKGGSGQAHKLLQFVLYEIGHWLPGPRGLIEPFRAVKWQGNGENAKRLNWPIALDFPHIYIVWTFFCRSGVAVSGSILAALRALKLCDQFAKKHIEMIIISTQGFRLFNSTK